MKRILYIIYILLAVTACTDHEWEEGGSDTASNKIVVGVTTSPLDITVSEAPTRAKQVRDAEEIEWLIPPLKAGLDITYGKVSDDPDKRNERVAILKLLPAAEGSTDKYLKDPDTGWAKYSFKYKDNGKDAIWYDNGEHYFEGMFVPDNLRYGPEAGTDRGELISVNTTSAPNITTDQSNETNYLNLAHYLAMPANTKIHATIGRVKLPFYHRLSRVIAYILIDPDMSPDPTHPVTLKGYKKDAQGNDNPSTTSLRFCNVEVLTGVHDTKNAQDYHVLTPRWNSIRKVIPHFEAEEGSMVQNATGNFEEKDADFYMFYDDKTQEYIFPTMEKWATYYSNYKTATDEQLKTAKVTRTNYGKVPVYDLIVRPTYTAVNSVMYDEHNASDQELSASDKTALVEKKNKIDFELTLSNGLIYTKEFTFDLNANEQTVVYLRISRESVNYNASGSDIWIKKDNNDDWYGVDNQLGHSLSKAGSTWQRAYTYSSTVDNAAGDITSPSEDKVTDGGFYNEKTNGEDGTVGQYVSLSTWIQKFAQAYEGGACHGDYFILSTDITIDAKSLPDDFVFTGHLDARGHKITLQNAGASWVEYVATTDYSIQSLYSDQNGTVYTLPTLYTKTHHDANYDDESELYKIEDVWYLKSSLKHVEEVSHNATEEDVTNGKAANVGDKVIDTPEHYEIDSSNTPVVKQDAGDDYNETSPALTDVMAAADGTYFIPNGTEYDPFTKPTTLYKKVDHTSGSALFAGLNGKYSAAEGVANVHTEGGFMVPYTNGTTGWRAEVMNLEVVGKLFADDVYTPDATTRTGYNVSKVSGNVQNCKDSQGKVPTHTPALFRYN